MSTIRPDLPAVLPQTSGDVAATRNAQAAFFRAALGQVQATAVQTTAQPATQRTATASPAAADPARPMRPGSLLDIRV